MVKKNKIIRADVKKKNISCDFCHRKAVHINTEQTLCQKCFDELQEENENTFFYEK